MQFQTPQFIEIEDKIFGPLTLRQFIYLAGCGGIAFILFKFLPFYVSVLLDIPIICLGLALAFYKVNRKPFIFVLESAVKYFLGSKLYIWKKEIRPMTPKEKEQSAPASLYIPHLSDSKLRDLTWSLDVKQSMGAQKSDKVGQI